MTVIKILSDAPSLSDSQKKQLLALHYKYLNYQRTVIKSDLAVAADLTVDRLFAGNKVAVAFDNDTPVSYCIYRVIRGVMKIRCMFVAEAERRKHLMTKLFAAMQTAQPHDCVVADVFKENYLAVQLFSSLGFNSEEAAGYLKLSLEVTSDAMQPA